MVKKKKKQKNSYTGKIKKYSWILLALSQLSCPLTVLKIQVKQEKEGKDWNCQQTNKTHLIYFIT